MGWVQMRVLPATGGLELIGGHKHDNSRGRMGGVAPSGWRYTEGGRGSLYRREARRRGVKWTASQPLSAAPCWTTGVHTSMTAQSRPHGAPLGIAFSRPPTTAAYLRVQRPSERVTVEAVLALVVRARVGRPAAPLLDALQVDETHRARAQTRRDELARLGAGEADPTQRLVTVGSRQGGHVGTGARGPAGSVRTAARRGGDSRARIRDCGSARIRTRVRCGTAGAAVGR